MSTNFGQKLSGVHMKYCAHFILHIANKDHKNDPDSLLECWILELYGQNMINFEAKKETQ